MHIISQSPLFANNMLKKILKMTNSLTVTLATMSIVLMLFFTSTSLAQTKAFPNAEGYGQYTTGGRGGEVYEVTNLNDSGPGSLREAIEASVSRTVVFRISGTIYLTEKLVIRNNDITIAGQTAPGDGICIAGYPFQIDADNVIIRFIRFRMGDENQQEADAIWGRESKDIIIDHCSMSWSIDESCSFYDNENFTLQWCIISESLNNSFHSKGEHGYGGIWGGMGATFHHNLLAHHTSRTPRFNGSRYHGEPEKEIVDFVNNVIYNWGFNSAYGGEGGNHNIRANYYKYGPATSESKRDRIVEPYDFTSNWYVVDNYVYGYPDITEDNWDGGVQGGSADSLERKNIVEPYPISPVTTQAAEATFEIVLRNAGVTFPARDSVDSRIIEETRTGVATYGTKYEGGGNGIIDSQVDVGGWPVLNSTEPPLDSDNDGMPDNWETANNLNPNNSEDRNKLSDEGYTMLEVYLNSLVEDIWTTADETEELFKDFQLYQNYPNPFNPTTKIKFNIGTIFHPSSYKSGSVRERLITLKVFDILGREVRVLINKELQPGTYEVEFNAVGLQSGIFFYTLSSGEFINTKKMILLK